MNPKEKAQEIYEKYIAFVGTSFHAKKYAIECSLISVNEVINSNPHSNPFNTNPFSTMDFWIEVKQEIENL
jgi:hypothetical protein